MSSTVSSAGVTRTSAARTALILVAVIVVAVALNALIAAIAVLAGAPASYAPLTLPVYGAFTAIGVVVGWVGWRLVQRRASNPRKVLAVLVPVVAVASFVPDLLLLWLQFIPGTTTAGVLALMAMHVVVVGVAVPGYALASRSRA